jgi:drug/metabolite transporter (DMT)-like permease
VRSFTNRTVFIANLAAFVASFFLGASVVATRKAVEDIAPIGLSTLRFGIGGFVLLTALIVFRSYRPKIPRDEFLKMAGLGLLVYSLLSVLFITSLRYTTASRGAVILALLPLFTALFAWLAGSERLTGQQWLGVSFTIAGVAVVFIESGSGLNGGSRVALGNVLMVLAAICGGIYGVVAKPVLARRDSMEVTAVGMLSGSGALLIPALINGTPHDLRAAGTKTLLLILYLGVLGAGLGFWLITFSLAHLTPTQNAVYINLNPMVATLLGALLLDEQMTVWFLFGTALVLTGLILTNWRRTRPAMATVPPEPAT